MTILHSTTAIAFLAAAFLIGGAAKAENHVAAKAECPSFPTVSWWGELSHDKTISLVTESYDGDWTLYAKKWRRHMAGVEKTQAMGWAFVYKKGGRLQGAALEDYALKAKERLSVIACLAEEDKIRTAETKGLDEFPTAAGSNLPAPQN